MKDTVEKKVGTSNSGLYFVPDVEEDELKAMQRAELQGTFNKIAGSNGINKGQFEVLAAALGQPMNAKKVDQVFFDLGIADDKTLEFDLFYEYWTSDVGATLFHT